MGFPENEVVAANQQRRDEEAFGLRVGGMLESGIPLAASAVAMGEALVSTGATGLAIAGSVVAGFGIAEWFRRLGSSKVNENLEALGQATEDALDRVERVLKEHGVTIDEIRGRLESDEFRDAMASASLQALRTTQKERLKRLALILANGVKDNDLSAERNDDMMRAAVELKDADISMLGDLYQLWKSFLDRVDKAKGAITSSPNFHNEIQNVWHNFGRSLNPVAQLEYRGSFARLQSHGMIQQVAFSNNEVGREPYLLLEDGARFYEHLRKIGEAK
jgi:DNA-binding transcriptional MerR regulator